MGIYNYTTDPTGQTDELQQIKDNLQGLIDEFNRTQDTQTAHFQQTDYSLTINDGTTNRILIGQFPDGDWGIIVSKSGVDVNTLFS